MFKKVLIVDDHGIVNEGVSTVLSNLGVKKVYDAQYCDDAYLKVKRAAFDKQPFDLIITDLSFKKDYRECKLSSGEDLIMALRQDYPDLTIIVYSMDDRLQKVRTLINKNEVNAYVCKGRQGATDLSKAIQAAYKNEQFLSAQVANALSSKINLEIDDYDIELVKQLSVGLLQDDISDLFKSRNLSPSSLSSIEKRLNRLRIQFKANNAIHLVAIVKDLGLI